MWGPQFAGWRFCGRDWRWGHWVIIRVRLVIGCVFVGGRGFWSRFPALYSSPSLNTSRFGGRKCEIDLFLVDRRAAMSSPARGVRGFGAGVGFTREPAAIHVLAVDDSSVDRAIIAGLLRSSKYRGRRRPILHKLAAFFFFPR